MPRVAIEGSEGLTDFALSVFREVAPTIFHQTFGEQAGCRTLGVAIGVSCTHASSRLVRIGPLLVFAVLIGQAVGGRATAKAQTPPASWDEGFGLPSISGAINVLVEAEGRLFVGGSFDAAGEEQVRNVTALSLGVWDPLSGGVNGPVHALAISAEGPLGEALYVGGAFSEAGSVPARNIARYDLGTGTWSALDRGVGTGDDLDVVRAIALGPDGALYVGGDFGGHEGHHGHALARWDGSNWSSIGDAGSTSAHSVNALVADAVRVCAGGSFPNVGGTPASNVACYDPSADDWSALDGGVSGGIIEAVNSLVLTEGVLYVGGRFTRAGDTGSLSAQNVAAYDTGSSSWSALGDGVALTTSLAQHEGDLYAGHLGQAPSIERWDGTAWEAVDVTPVSGGPNGVLSVESLARIGDALYIGTNDPFLIGGGSLPVALFRLDLISEVWEMPGLGAGLQARGRSLATGPDGRLYAGGDFLFAGVASASHIAAWDGETWSQLDGGLDGPTSAISFDGRRMYVVGEFSAAGNGGDTVSGGVVAWDSDMGRWSAMGRGVAGNGRALLPSPEGVYVAGGFDAVIQTDGTRVPVEDVALWTPSAERWAAVPGGHGVDVPFALARDEAGGLYLGGVHIRPDNRGVGRVARLGRGSNDWVTLRDWVGYEVRSLDVEGALDGSGELRVGVHGDGVWVLDRAGWTPLGGPREVQSLLSLAGSLIAVGENVWEWDGSGWSVLGGGIAAGSPVLTPMAYAVVVWDGAVCVSGEFQYVGASSATPMSSANVGCYGPFATSAQPSRIAPAEPAVVAPHPLQSRGLVSFSLGHPTLTDWSLFDARGREVAQGTLGQVLAGPAAVPLDVSALPPGLYVLRIEADRTITATITVAR